MWQSFFFGSRGDVDPALWQAIQMARFATDHLHKIAHLLLPDSARDMPTMGIQSDRALSVIIIEPNDTLSSPLRLSLVLTSITQMYEVIAGLEQIKPNTLSVVACDSGSDKSFDFIGVAKAIHGVKEIILGLYDRIAFHREHRTQHQIETIAKTLPVIERVHEMEKNGSLSPEQAELYRRKVTDSAVGFVECGAIIPEMEMNAASCDPRQVMAVEPKLLSAPIDGGSQSPEKPKQRRRKKDSGPAQSV